MNWIVLLLVELPLDMVVQVAIKKKDKAFVL